MITTKYNFKIWLHRQYPDITATPIYGVAAYILSKPLNTTDNFIYNVQQLKDGRYIVFIGMSPAEAQRNMLQLNEGRIPTRVHSIAAPTTFGSFEQWLTRNNIVPLNRTFCSHVSASQALMTSDIHNCIDIDAIKTWYLYELPIADGTSLSETEQEQYSKVPYIITKNRDGISIVIVLVKACNSTYKSKRTLFMEKFSLMQPLYEQLISAAALAKAQDEVQAGTGDWGKVKLICEQYMGIQFEAEGTVDIEKMKEAANEGMLGIWTRDRGNLKDSEDTTF